MTIFYSKIFLFWMFLSENFEKTPQKNLKQLFQVLYTCARRFELPTPWSVAKCSIQLSYTHIMPATGIEPVPYCYDRILSPARLPVPPRRHFNGTNRARTCDPLLVRQVLSQLSYDPILTTQKGLEPSTSAVTGRRSNQLSHRAILRFVP